MSSGFYPIVQFSMTEQLKPAREIVSAGNNFVPKGVIAGLAGFNCNTVLQLKPRP